MSNIKFFYSNEFGKMRTYRDPNTGEVWFCLADACKALDINNSRNVKASLMDRGLISLNVKELGSTVHTMDRTPTEDLDNTVATTYPISTNGRTQNATFVNESGLYNVIFSSKSPKAIPFRKWIWSEVLFKDTVKGLLGNPDFMIKILEKLKAEKEENKRLQQIIDENKPKVDFANAALESVGSALTKELALWLQKDNRKDQH